MPFGKNSLKSLCPRAADIQNPIHTSFQAQKFLDSILPLLRKSKTTSLNMRFLWDTAKTKGDCLKGGWKPKEAILGIVSIALLSS